MAARAVGRRGGRPWQRREAAGNRKVDLMAMFSPFGDDEYNEDGTPRRHRYRYGQQQAGAAPTLAPATPAPVASPQAQVQSQQSAGVQALPLPPTVPVTRPRADGAPGDAPADWVQVFPGSNFY